MQQNKDFLNRLRLLIAASSFIGFIGGWLLLARAGAADVSTTNTPTPVQIATSVPLPTATATATTLPAASAAPTGQTAASATPQPSSTATATPTLVRATATPKATATKLRTGSSG